MFRPEVSNFGIQRGGQNIGKTTSVNLVIAGPISILWTLMCTYLPGNFPGSFWAISRTCSGNCLRFANPAEAIGGRHSEAERLRCVEAQKLGRSDMLILEASWIFLMVSGVIEYS